MHDNFSLYRTVLVLHPWPPPIQIPVLPPTIPIIIKTHTLWCSLGWVSKVQCPILLSLAWATHLLGGKMGFRPKYSQTPKPTFSTSILYSPSCSGESCLRYIKCLEHKSETSWATIRDYTYEYSDCEELVQRTWLTLQQIILKWQAFINHLWYIRSGTV